MRHQTSNLSSRAKSRDIERRTSAYGFTIVECLLSLAITALLMTAVAVALNASLTNYQENEQMFRTINSARQALTRITSQLRTAKGVDTNLSTTSCSLATDTDPNVTYAFRSNAQKLYLTVNNQDYVLCDHVTAATFTKTLTSDGMDCKSVQISLTVQNGGRQRTLAAAAVVRRNLDL